MKSVVRRLTLVMAITVVWLSLGCFSCHAAQPKGVYSKNVNATQKIALTFDDGPHPRYTEQILDILNRYHVTATFFMIGCNISYYPESFQKILESGCEVGNHTYSHRRVKEMTEREIIRELISCEDMISKAGGEKTTLFRPPQGALNNSVMQIAESLGYTVVLWSIDTLDWAHNPPAEICQNVIDSVENGDIILMHDYVSGTNTTCHALELLIPALLERGYEFVTVSQLLTER